MNPTAPWAAQPCLAVTMGEPSGVGPEVTLKAWLRRSAGVPPFVAISDADHLKDLADRLGLDVPVQRVDRAAEASSVFAQALPVAHHPLPVPIRFGHPDARTADAVIASIEQAVGLVTEGGASAVVTCPIQKNALYEAGFRYPGHTEFLESLAGGQAAAVMMLAGPTLRVVPVTVHVSLQDAVRQLTTQSIVNISLSTARALTTDFGIREPVLAIAGLNPHAGEQGSLGREDAEVVAPAVQILRDQGLSVLGPVPPDTLFTPLARSGYDVAICMYHDQGLIPLKALDFDKAVNVTLGLPFVRTSPDHGTALDIAGTGRASEESLVAAMCMAWDIAARRAAAR